jgi:uncharacterized protein YggE
MTSTRTQRWTMLVILATLVAGLLVVTGVGRAGPTVARAADSVADDTVDVVGVGETEGVPDEVTVNFGVRVTRTSVEAALDARSEAAHKLIDALRAQGLDDKDLQTTDLSLYRRHKRHDPTEYYVASESVQATISPIDTAGETIDAAARSSRYVDIGGMSFDIKNDAALITEARANAYADAKKKAEQYADLAGRTLARVERVSETVRNPGRVYYGAAAGSTTSADRAPAPIEAGTQTVRVRVTIVWQLA